jgi:GAF domain-containing protein/HAMP domain-containing protein
MKYTRKIHIALVLIGILLTASYLFTENTPSWKEEAFLVVRVIVVLYVYYVLREGIIRPLEQMHRLANEVLEGKTPRPIEYPQYDEIGMVAEALNRITYSIGRATNFVQQLGAGNFQATYDHHHSHQDALANALLAMCEQMKKVIEEEHQRNWVAEGLAQFVYLLRDLAEADMNTFSNRMIADLARYLNAVQGGIYLLVETPDGQLMLELQGVYAGNSQVVRQQTFALGESLLGQSVIDKQIIHVHELPATYTQVGSGLGSTHPRELLIVPLLFNQEVLGALELASFEPFQPHHINFVKQLAENTASVLLATRSNARNRRLLDEAHLLTEQMRAQDEEMRQAMEEMQATQEETLRKQRELEKYQENLEIQTRKLQANEEILKKFIQQQTQESQRLNEQIKKQASRIAELEAQQPIQ